MNEMYHYGVPGMKWGQRHAARVAARSDRAIGRFQTIRKNNANVRKVMDKESREDYAEPKKAKKLSRSLASNKALYDISEVTNKYGIAKAQAKKDPSYKNTPDYKKAKAAYSKQQTQSMIYGTFGNQRIETLKNDGYTERKAKGRVLAEQLVASAAVTAAVAGYALLTNNN